MKGVGVVKRNCCCCSNSCSFIIFVYQLLLFLLSFSFLFFYCSSFLFYLFNFNNLSSTVNNYYSFFIFPFLDFHENFVSKQIIERKKEHQF